MASPAHPTPLSLPAKRCPGTTVTQQTRELECLPCGTRTPHVRGRATYSVTGELLVQWWKCTECPEGEAL